MHEGSLYSFAFRLAKCSSDLKLLELKRSAKWQVLDWEQSSCCHFYLWLPLSSSAFLRTMGGSLRIETQQRPSWLIGGDLSKQPSRHVVYINSTEQWSSASISVNSRVFLKRHFEKKIKKNNPVRYWGGPWENISRRRGWSDKSRGPPKALEVWKKSKIRGGGGGNRKSAT